MKKIFFALFFSPSIFSTIQVAAQSWNIGGNALAATGRFGATTNRAIAFITNNMERARLDSNGNWAFGTSGSSDRVRINAATGGIPLRAMINGSTKFVVHSAGGVAIGNTVTPPTNGLYVWGDTRVGGRVSIGGTTAPVNVLDVAGANNWDVSATEGDVRIGNSTYRLKIGVSLSGLGAGDVRIRAVGGTNRLMLGGENALTVYNRNVGIQKIDPRFPLSFPNETGDKISFWDGGANGNYGIGIQGGLLQIHANQSSDDIAFGYGTSQVFTERMRIKGTGNVGIGTNNPTYKLSVNGTIQAKELRIEAGWADYVFEKDYKLPSLESVATYIEKNKHLPGVASAKDIREYGLAVGEMQTKLMEKIEELTLYIIALNAKIKALEKQNATFKNQIVNQNQ